MVSESTFLNLGHICWVTAIVSILWLPLATLFCRVSRCYKLSAAALLEEKAAVSPHHHHHLPGSSCGGFPTGWAGWRRPRLPHGACLLVSAQSCASRLEYFTPGFPIRGRLCVSVCVCQVSSLLSGSKQYFKWFSQCDVFVITKNVPGILIFEDIYYIAR